MAVEDRIVNQFMALVAIDSLSFKERQMADYLKPQLEALGLSVYEDDCAKKTGGNCGNLICNLKGNPNKPCIMLSSHMDTVEPGIGKKSLIKDGYIYSDGTTILGSDDLAGVAAIIEALTCIKEKGLDHGDIQVVLTTAEEKGLQGAENLDFSKVYAKYGFIFDMGGSIGTVAIKSPTQYTIKAVFHGKTAHAGMEPEKGISAIKMAAHAINNMNTGRISQNTTANIGIISGGIATNIVCDHVEILGEARSLDDSELQEQLLHMRTCIESAAKEFGGSVEIEERPMYKSVNISLDSEYYSIIEKACNACDVEISPVNTGGGSDANIFNQMGIISTAISVGMENVHTKEERIKISDLVKSSELVEAIVLCM